jgi:outer membrane protein insertion porin family/translocation and assembly module TamA
VLALRGRLGYVRALSGTNARLGIERTTGDAAEQLLHPRTRFYAGGSQSVRGFGENQLGPRVLTIDPNAIRGRVIRNDNKDTTYASAPGCAPPGSIVTCYGARRDSVGDGNVIARPLGGTAIIEGNVELRIPITGPLVAAVFVDGALLGERSIGSIGNGTRAITPGVGVRYQSPVGPVRLDLGFRPSLREALPVITEEVRDGVPQLVDLTAGQGCATATTVGCRVFPREEAASFLNRLTRRLTLHVSIGEAF